MNLKQRNGGYLCVACGCPVQVNNALTLRLLEMGKPIKCDKCRRGKDNGQLWQSYEEYLQSYTWKMKAEECKRRAGRRCQVCNSPDNLRAHHRIYGQWGDEQPGDLTCLCDDCHTIFHEHRTLHIK